MSAARFAAGFLVIAVGACASDEPARPQWRVAVSTDAPVPPLADRLLVEVLDASGALACSACSRLFGIDRGTTWPVSFGVVPTGRERFVRARLYRSERIDANGLPQGSMLIDGLGELEAPEGVTDVALRLSMACFGRAAEPSRPAACDPLTGATTTTLALKPGAPLEVGRAPIAVESECDEIPSGMACVKGGVFVLGDSRTVGSVAPAAPERLVRIDAFAMDIDEMTVREARPLLAKVGGNDRPGRRGENVCTFTTEPSDNDELPLNCVSHALAAALCNALGKRLPTEAEWEYAAGSRGEERQTPWGDVGTACFDAILARGRSPQEGVQNQTDSTSCRVVPGEPTRPFGPVRGGSARDLTREGLRNLGGNLTEWVSGAPAPYDDACFGPEGPLTNPECNARDEERLVRGGYWAVAPVFSATTFRGVIRRGIGDSYTGVRCVMPFGRK